MKRLLRLFPILLIMSELAACSGRPQWVKPGANTDAVRADLAECNALADTAVSRDANIDNDILATRGADWQRTGTLAAKKTTFAVQDHGRARDIIQSCMAAKGYAPRS